MNRRVDQAGKTTSPSLDEESEASSPSATICDVRFYASMPVDAKIISVETKALAETK